MKHSTDRILATHVGSLPRPEDMLAALTAKMRGQLIDEQALDARLPRAVADIVRQLPRTRRLRVREGRRERDPGSVLAPVPASRHNHEDAMARRREI